MELENNAHNLTISAHFLTCSMNVMRLALIFVIYWAILFNY